MEDSIYREQIIDLYENPLNFGALDRADFTYEEDNPLCGDVIQISIKLDDDQRVVDVGWEGQGCAISQASASMLTELLQGKSLEEAKAIDKDDILELLGIEIGPVRIKCALLSLKVLKAGVYGLSEAEWEEDDDDW